MFPWKTSQGSGCLLPALVLLFCYESFSVHAELPTKYDELPARGKLEILWRQISANPYSLEKLPTAQPSLANMSKIMSAAYLAQSFLHTGDEMPKDRLRIIHTYGSVAKIELQIFDNSTFTGVFKSGGIGLIRFSLGTQSNESFPPGLAIKILIDGKASQNFQLLNSRTGQGQNRNFFAKPMRNIFEGTTKALTPVEKAFQASFDFLPGAKEDKPEDLTNLGLYEQASVNSDGSSVSTIVAPYLVTFAPNPALSWNPDDRTDYRVHLADVSEGTILYTVSVKRTLDEDDNVIGQLISRSAVMATPYGDETLFFNHARKSWQP